jgi:trans-feruloyl-CoA hydratase/vanillin synthase
VWEEIVMPLPGLQTVRVEKADGIGWVTLNRPEKRNAMSPELHFEMCRVLDDLEFDDDVRVLVLTGAGNAWCAGQDLKLFFRDLEGKPKEFSQALAASHYWRWQKLFAYPKPTIAMVNGYCFGGAFTQLIACDFAIASSDATFGLSEVNWGVLPSGFVSKALTECLGLRDAVLYALTGDSFSAREAERCRLITWAVPAANLREETEKLAHKLIRLNPEALRAAKTALKHVRPMPEEPALDFLAAKTNELLYRDKSKGKDEGIRQFLDEKSYRPGMQPYRRQEAE